MKKTTSKNFSKLLAQYGALSTAILGISNAEGQVHYTDLGSSLIDIPFYQLDLDGDEVLDFRFRLYYSTNLLVVPIVSSNAILGSDPASFPPPRIFPYVLNSSAPISNSATGTWFSFNGYYQTLNAGNCVFGLGNWCDPTSNKYLGLRFEISGTTHYGWARISVFHLPGIGDYPNSGWALTGYAYEETEDAPIMAGDMGALDIYDNEFSKIKVVALHKTIGLYNLPVKAQYKVYNITGQEVLQGTTNERDYVIEAPTLASGVYVIELGDTNTNAVIRKKIVLQ